MVTIQDAVIVSRGIVVAQIDTSSVHTVDVPSLGVVHAHTFKGIVGNPGGHIVIGEVKKVGKTFFTSNIVEYGGSGIGANAIIQIIDILGNFNHANGFVKDSTVEIAVTEDGVHQVPCSC